jgi:hypothetical protein
MIILVELGMVGAAMFKNHRFSRSVVRAGLRRIARHSRGAGDLVEARANGLPSSSLISIRANRRVVNRPR